MNTKYELKNAIKKMAEVVTSTIFDSVASPGIEPGSWVPETHILSIVLRGHYYFFVAAPRIELGSKV